MAIILNRSIIDLNKKFYKSGMDLAVLQKIDAIREAIKNKLTLNENDIPLEEDVCNIEYQQLKYLDHFNATKLIERVKFALETIDYVKTVKVVFNYESAEKKMQISFDLEDVNEDVIFNIDLAA